LEQRKIVALGKSSLVITLPKDWLRVNKLNRGDMVSFVIGRDQSLIIQPSFIVKEREKMIHLNIEIDETKDSIIRGTIGCYLNGYTDIKLSSRKFFDVEQQKAIRYIASKLYLRIMESGARSITLRTLLDESKASVNSSIERMHLITYSMCEDILNSMKNWDENIAKSVLSLEDDVDQLMFLILRLVREAALNPSLAKQYDLNPLDCLDFQTLVHRIERIADHITTIASDIVIIIESQIDVPEKILSNLIKAAEIAFTYYDKAVQAFISKDIKPTNEIIKKEKEIDELYQLITPMPIFNKQDSSILSNIISMREGIKKISHYSADIAELTINRAYSTKNT
jgi:phosphate uptake regulator